MKLSVMTDVLGTESFEEALEIIQQLGFSWIDIRSKLNGSNIDQISMEQAKQLKQAIDRQQLRVSCLTSWGVNPISFTGEPPAYDIFDESVNLEMLDKLERLCNLAEVFETSCIRIYSLPKPAGFERLAPQGLDHLYQHNANIMRRHAELAGRKNKTILIENEPPSLTSNAALLSKMIKDVNHPHLKINWDIINEWIGGSYPTLESFKLIQDAVVQLHIKGGYKKPDSESSTHPYGEFHKVGIPGKDDFDHAPILHEIVHHIPDITMTFDPHYMSLDEADKIGEVEVVRQSKQYIESVLAQK